MTAYRLMTMRCQFAPLFVMIAYGSEFVGLVYSTRCRSLLNRHALLCLSWPLCTKCMMFHFSLSLLFNNCCFSLKQNWHFVRLITQRATITQGNLNSQLGIDKKYQFKRTVRELGGKNTLDDHIWCLLLQIVEVFQRAYIHVKLICH